jgi:peptidoglycan/LPS O-acetylase OafA/YrhL
MARKMLGAYVVGRDNNYNLIRVLAASAVLFSHSYAIATGDSAVEPPRALIGMSFGDLAVDIFFFASGLLVTGSLVNRPSIPAFILARVRRIYPGLLVAITLTVLVVGPMFTTLSVSAYFLNRETILYWLRNVTLVTNVSHDLPGVFESNPFHYSVNGSLWTLPYEISMYAGLAILAAVLGRQSPRFLHRLLTVAAVITLGTLLLHFIGTLNLRPSGLLRVTAFFWTGVCFFLLRERIEVNGKFGLVLLAVLAVCALDRRAFLIAYSLALPYLIVCAAYLPGGILRRYNRIGDYSYGIYIYGSLVQQCLVAAEPGISIAGLFVQSASITVMLAIVSWHLIESPMLHAGKAVARRPPTNG